MEGHFLPIRLGHARQGALGKVGGVRRGSPGSSGVGRHRCVGVREPAKEVSFQIGVIPSAAQLGNAPALLFGIAMTGSDESTDGVVQDSEADLTTDIARFDPAVKASDAKVVQ